MYARARGALAALLVSFGAAQAQTPTAATAAARRDLLATDSLWSRRSLDSGLAAMASAIPDDAYLLMPGEPVMHGRAPAAAWLHRVGWRASGAGLSRDGAFGYTYGYSYGDRAATEAEQAMSTGKYIAVWRRRSGVWELAALTLCPGAATVLPDSPVAFALPVGDAAGAGESDARIGAMAADSAFARSASTRGVAGAFAEFAADDAAILSGPPAIVVGPEAIRAVYAGLPAGARLVWAPLDGRAAASGDLAFTVGEAMFSIVDPASAGARTRRTYSKYLTVWRRQSDGRWKYVVDGGSARPAGR